MTGYTGGETPVQSSATTYEEFEAFAKDLFGDRADEYLAICKKDGADLEQMKMNGKYNRFEIGALLWADFNARLNAPKMYLYKFDPEIPGDDAGSFHSSELWFVFETLAKCWRPFKGKHYDLARQMCNYWTNFAKTGDPNGLDADGTPMPEWRPVQGDDRKPMLFADEAGMQEDPRSDLINFLIDYSSDKLLKNEPITHDPFAATRA